VNDVPYQYQPADGCCVPSALINCLVTMFDASQIPATVIGAIYHHALDHPKCRRTTSVAIEEIANDIDRIGCERPPRKGTFSCSAQYLSGEQVTLAENGLIAGAVRRGGTAMLLLSWPHSVRHAVTALGMDRKYVHCFDPMLRKRYSKQAGCTFLRKPSSTHAPNLKIERAWLEQTTGRLYSLGPIRSREAVIVEP